MNRIYEYFVALSDLFMPRACLACGCRLGMRERHLCLSCAADVPYTRSWLAAHNPFADRFNAVLERHRGTEPMDYAYAAALIYYKGAYRAIPRALKYQGDLAAGRHYGSLLGRRLAAAPHFADIDLVIPVPLHWTRRRSRGSPLDPPPLPRLQPSRNPRPRPCLRLPLRPCSRSCRPRSCPCRPDHHFIGRPFSFLHCPFDRVLIRSVREMASRSRP